MKKVLLLSSYLVSNLALGAPIADLDLALDYVAGPKRTISLPASCGWAGCESSALTIQTFSTTGANPQTKSEIELHATSISGEQSKKSIDFESTEEEVELAAQLLQDGKVEVHTLDGSCGFAGCSTTKLVVLTPYNPESHAKNVDFYLVHEDHDGTVVTTKAVITH